MNVLRALRIFRQLHRHFDNSYLIPLLRLGVIKLRYFPYAIRKGQNSYLMLARSSTTALADLFVFREVLVEETYRDVLPILPRRRLRVVDIGANLGSFTIWLSHAAKGEEAFCVEPEPDSFRLLQFNLARNSCGFAHALEQSVGSQSRTLQIFLKEDSTGVTNIYDATSGGGRSQGNAIQVVALSEWLGQTPGAFDLLKMDCEGSEWEIVRRSSAADLAGFRAVMAEVHADPEGLQPVEQFGKLLEANGCRTVRWDRKAFGLYVGVRDSQAAGL
ncbi:MAG: FkbM family methyltransferase [Verrucomicrobia bacterium]|nr:FkbM family methyltransferase [Verrucomicrobiota bacterium]